jgi:16S rRNA (cytidine1402-2'-O)-methyltransferase
MLAHYSAHRPRSEYTLIVEGLRWRDYARDDDPAVEALPSESEVAERLRILRTEGRSGSAASREVARALGLSRSIVYQVWISLDREGTPGQ